MPLISANALTSSTPNIGSSLALVIGALAACGFARVAPAPSPTPAGEPAGRIADGKSLA